MHPGRAVVFLQKELMENTASERLSHSSIKEKAIQKRYFTIFRFSAILEL